MKKFYFFSFFLFFFFSLQPDFLFISSHLNLSWLFCSSCRLLSHSLHFSPPASLISQVTLIKVLNHKSYYVGECVWLCSHVSQVKREEVRRTETRKATQVKKKRETRIGREEQVNSISLNKSHSSCKSWRIGRLKSKKDWSQEKKEKQSQEDARERGSDEENEEKRERKVQMNLWLVSSLKKKNYASYTSKGERMNLLYFCIFKDNTSTLIMLIISWQAECVCVCMYLSTFNSYWVSTSRYSIKFTDDGDHVKNN